MTFSLSDKEFLQLKEIIYKASGIYAQSDQKATLEHKLSSRIAKYSLNSFHEYHQFLLKNRAEVQMMVNAVTTNETYFFREKKHFDFLKNSIIPNIKYELFRCWSAAGSNGAEAYSIAMQIKSYLSAYKNFEIVMSDINNNVIEFAKKAVYPIHFSKKIPISYLKEYCHKGQGKFSGYFKIDDKIKSYVSFKQINLMKPIDPSLGMFDLIFLRNMIIYFEDKDKKIIVENVIKHLKEGGYLFMGHSESLSRLTDKVVQISPSIYQKVSGRVPNALSQRQSYSAKVNQRVVAIGSSMGGLSVIKEMILHLNSNTPPILIVQHMSRDIVASFIEKFSDKDIKVILKEAKEDELLQQGVVYFAPYNRHLGIKNISKGMYKIVLSDGDKVSNHKPSIDVLFESLAKEVKNYSHAFILSGMGNDGVNGIANVKKVSGKTYAQDEQSSDVYGMSKIAINNSSINHIFPAHELAQCINGI
jgi:chemotaxis protein methyltransferase CheR